MDAKEHMMTLPVNCPKDLIRIYECSDINDLWSYDENKPVAECDNLSNAHGIAYDLWVKNPTKAYSIIRVWDNACSGAYGFPEDEDFIDL